LNLLYVFFIALALFSFYVLFLYNRLVKYKVESDNAFAQIDVQLKRRWDLIPRLVEVVKGYMAHERETLQKVVEARSRALGSSSLPDRLQAEGEIGVGVERLLAVWEQYPDLKADQAALKLQEELVTTENRIAYTRAYYNDISANYNTQLLQFPSNLLAGWMGFAPKTYFRAGADERAVPVTRF